MTSRSSFACAALAFLALGFGCGHESAEESATGAQSHTLDFGEAHDTVHEAHEDHAAHVTAPALKPGQLWPTDEPLRMAMQRIGTAVDQAASAQEKKQFTPTAARALAGTVDENVAYMIANCKLAPQPDAALHVLIGRMLNASVMLKRESDSADGVTQLRAVLHDYQSTFDHPGWPVG